MAFPSFMLYISVAVFTAFFSGVGIALSMMHKFADGSIVIDHSTDEPVPFLEVEDNSGDILNSKKYVVLAVEHRNYLKDAK